MNPIAKGLLVAGTILIIAGLFIQFGGKNLPIGKLPGDIAIERDNFKFYFPITTSIIFSVVLSLIAYFFKK